MKKRILCCLLTCILVLTLVPMNSFGGVTKKSRDGMWKIEADTAAGTCTVYEYYGKAAGDFVIPDEIDGLKVTKVKAYGYESWNDSEEGTIETLTLPAHLEEIGDFTFQKMKALKHINFPEGMTTAGSRAFYSCTALEEVTLPSQLKIIPNQMFYQCTSLESVMMSEYTEEVGRYAFMDCVSLKGIDLPPTLKLINDMAFAGSGLAAIKVPDSAVLEERVFDGCKDLKSVNLPTSGKQVYSRTFAGCESLERIKIPSCYSVFGTNAFAGCKNLTTVVFEDDAKLSDYGTFPKTKKLTIYHPSSAKKVAAYCDKNSIHNRTLDPPKWISKKRTTTSVTLKWKKVSGAVQYKVYKKTGSGSYKLVRTTTKTSYKNTGLKKKVTYKYYIKTVKKDVTGVKLESQHGSVYTTRR